MAKQEQTRVLGSLPLLVAVAFIAGGVVVSRLPLRSTRPKPPEKLEAPRTNEDMVEARLWQDPFKAAQDHHQAMHGEGNSREETCPSPHCVNQIETELHEAIGHRCLDFPNRPPAVQVLTILVRHTASDEDYERRLRNRVAVHTALNAAGMEPDDTLHIRYFALGPSEGWSGSSKPVIVPFETFRRDKLLPEVKRPARELRPEKLIVVWFPEGAVGESPLAKLADLTSRFMGAKRECYLQGALAGDWPSLRFDVIGPSRSQMLQIMLEELSQMSSRNAQADKDRGAGETARRDSARDAQRVLKHVTFFSPWSTASPVLLTKSLPDKSQCVQTDPADPNTGALDSITELADMFDLVASRFRQAGIKFVRMIGTDDLLSIQIIEELRRRRIYVCPKETGESSGHIALVCERDTFYGRASSATFATMVACYDPKQRRFDWGRYAKALSEAPPHGLCPNVHVYTYNSGIDGQLPGEAWEEANDASSDDRRAKPVWTPRKGLELPIGRGRLDYGRRLAGEIRQHYRRYEGHELQAIGVMGSDVYDKMTLLHALREEFGDIALFTTDIDARLLYHKQIGRTRNVIVASNYGLKLSAAYQLCATECMPENSESYGEEEVPTRFAPFRDNYQTALFLACRAALGLPADVGNGRVPFRELDQDILTEALSHPRLFEIGRGQAIDLSVTKKAPAVDVHPKRPRYPGLFPLLRRHLWLLLSLPIGAALLWPVVRGVLPLLSRLERRAYEEVTEWQFYMRPYRVIGAFSALAVIILACVIVRDHYNPEGEPFSLTTGTSAWPGILIFFAAMLLSLLFFECSRLTLRANANAIAKEFHLPALKPPTGPFVKRAKSYLYEALKRANKSLKKACEPSDEKAGSSSKSSDRKTADATKLWKLHIQEWRLDDRVLWPVVWFFGLWLFPLVLVFGLGRPHHPCRGATCYFAYGSAGFLCLVFLLLLLILVAGETRRRLRMINPIINKDTKWPVSDPKNTEPASKETEPDSKERQPGSNETQPPDLAHLLDVRFVARLTEGAGELVYFPSVTLLLLIAARLPYFDLWGLPPLVLVVHTIPLAYILGMMATLQLAARRARATALFYLQKQLDAIDYGMGPLPAAAGETGESKSAKQTEQATGSTAQTAEPKQSKRTRQTTQAKKPAETPEEKPTTELPAEDLRAKRERIKQMITEIEELREGAFRPFAENPIVHALLIPSGGAGLLAVLTFLLPS